MITYLLIIGRLATPAAMVVFLTYEINDNFTAPNIYWRIAVLIGAMCTAVGVESVGISAGHALERFSRRDEWGRTLLVISILVGYTAVTMMILWSNEALRLVPIVAAIVYVLSALIEGEAEATEQEQGQQERRFEFELEQEAKDRDIARQENLIKAEANKAVRLAKVTAVPMVRSADSSKTDWRHFSDSERVRLLDLTREEITREYGVSTKTAGRWLENAEKLSVKLSSKNGQGAK